MTEQYLASSADNKWSKNGYGQAVERDLGKFSREESETVRNAVQDYCSRKAISTARLCSECDHKAELKGAWMEIAKSIPHRTVQSVYRHGLRQLHPFKRGPWSEQEVATLHELIARMGKKWSAIQAKMNRSADSCRDKFREINSDYTKGYVCMCCLAITYVMNSSLGVDLTSYILLFLRLQKYSRWKEPETELLKRLVREQLHADPNADIIELGRLVEQQNISIPWTVISKKMGKRSRLSCFKKWQKLTGITSSAGSESSKDARGRPVTAAQQVIDFNNATDEDLDIYLLTELINQGKDPPEWSSFTMMQNPQERWNDLFNEWQMEEAITPDELGPMTLFQVAHAILQRKQQNGDAKLAAATVEAVDLPTVTLTDTREV